VLRASAVIVGVVASTVTLVGRVPVLAAQLGAPPAASASAAPVTSPPTDDVPRHVTVPTTSTTAAPTTTTTAAPTTTTAAAPRATASASPSGPWYEQVGRQALATIHYPIASTGFTVRFSAARAGYLGLTDPDTRTINIYVRPSESVAYVARIIAHELGHAVDVAFNTDARRARWEQLRGISSRPWFGCGGCTDFSAPSGDFAEAFAYWLVRPADYRSTLAAPPSASQLPQLLPLFSR